jgi:putative protease
MTSETSPELVWPELLAPAGNLEKLKTAILYGADAVYAAGPQFGLRGGSDNLTDFELQEALRFAHQHHAKLYITLNAFLHDQELEQLPEYVQLLQELNVDGVIVSDLGVITTVQEHSSIPVHLSTQASCLTASGARLWQSLGVDRIVLGREVSIQEARRIRSEAGVEVEIFIHGAMCMAFSGNCTISNYTAGRDSNRGGCIQSCRFEYQLSRGEDFRGGLEGVATLFSSKDLRGLQLLPQVVGAAQAPGIDSLKVEGRMKSPLYVASTTRAYRQALNGLKRLPPEDWVRHLERWSLELEKLPHRGYTDGSLNSPAGPESVYPGNREDQGWKEWEFAGTVLEASPERGLLIQTQNPIASGDELELLPFSGETVRLSSEHLELLGGKRVDRINPNRLIRLPGSFSAEPFNLIRKRSGARPPLGNQAPTQQALAPPEATLP